MADYPASIFDPRVVENVDGTVYDPLETTRIFAEDVNSPNEEIVAIEEILGVNPQAEFETVLAYLNYLRAAVRNKIVFPDFSTGMLSVSATGITYSSYRALLTTGATINTNKYVIAPLPFNLILQSGKLWEEFGFNFQISSTSNVSVWCGQGFAQNVPTSNFVGLKAVNGTLYFFARGDGGTTIEESLGAYTANVLRRIRIVCASDVGPFKVYLNESLVYDGATTISGLADPYTPCFGIINTAASTRNATFGNFWGISP